MQEEIKKLFIRIANAGNISEEDLDFAYRVGYHSGIIDTLDKQLKEKMK